LCQIIYDEDKYEAIPQILRISKYKFTVDFLLEKKLLRVKE
jgi:hypothetical protein